MNAAEIVSEVRRGAGLSRSELARRSGVPRSTVTRTEDGVVDPTLGMLQRILGATRSVLEVSAQPLPTLSIARLCEARSNTPWGEAIDWTRLRAAVDDLTMHPADLQSAIATPPPRSGSTRLDALLAGMLGPARDLKPDFRLQRRRLFSHSRG